MSNILDPAYMRPWDLKRPRSGLYNNNRTYSTTSSNGSSSCDNNKYSYAYQHLAVSPNRPSPPTASEKDGRFDTYQDPKDCIQEIMNQLEESGEEIYTEFNGGSVPGSNTARADAGVETEQNRGLDDDDYDEEEGLYDLPYDSKKTTLTTSVPGYSHVARKSQRPQKFKKAESVENRNNGGNLSVSSPPPVVSPNDYVDGLSGGSNGDDHESIYQNSLKLLDEIEYIDTAQLMRKIQSKPDASSGQIVVDQKSPMPMPRQRVPVTSPVADNNVMSLADSFNNSRAGASGPGNTDSMKRWSLDKKDISSPMLLGENHHIMKDRKVIPVMKAPQAAPSRLKSKHDPLMPPAPPAKPLSSNGANLKQFSFDNNNSKNDHLTTELKTKVRAVRTVPSLTGGHSNVTPDGNGGGSGGRNQYENNILLK